MRIPIDRYRLLGVSVGADGQMILNNLERRIERNVYSGFSNETNRKREEILRDNTEVLINSEKRIAYEKDFVNREKLESEAEPTVDIKQDYEIAGLLLLLESGELENCIKISEQVFRQKRLDMNYFSTDFKDLNKIIDYATLGYAEELKSRRHYQTASEVLDRRIKSHTVGMGEKEMILIMAQELKQLLPFRILDMLSRANDEESHATGVALLKKLVSDRGGLDMYSEEYMSTDEFHEFFRQIRGFLTVQEQINLYDKWAKEGSEAATFLYSIALVAQGFSQRKPNKICTAINNMKKVPSNELQPIVANMLLLLGDVDNAKKLFDQYADDQLKTWTFTKAEEPLARLCEWCREWLQRDVLKGYKDIDSEADIDDYFSDKDVIAYIEGNDDMATKGAHDSTTFEVNSLNTNRESSASVRKKKEWAQMNNSYARPKQLWVDILGKRIRYLSSLRESFLIFLVITVSSCSLLFFTRLASQKNRVEDTERSVQVIKTETSRVKNKIELARDSLEQWLQLKKQVLSENRMPLNASLVASEGLLKQLEDEKEVNQKKGIRQYIDASLKNLRIIEQSPNRMKILAKLRYRDKLVNSSGKTIETTQDHTFERYYQLIWQGGKWVVDK